MVETTNFNPRSVYRQANPETLRLTERFTRVAPDRINWSVTVDDASTWVRPWTFAVPLTIADTEPLMEYGCHEGNYAMTNILSGARAEERAVDEDAKRGITRAPRAVPLTRNGDASPRVGDRPSGVSWRVGLQRRTQSCERHTGPLRHLPTNA